MRSGLGLVGGGEPPKGRMESVRHHVDMVNKYFRPMLVGTGLDSQFRIGEQVYALYDTGAYADWAQLSHRIEKETSGLLLEIFLKDSHLRPCSFQIWVRPSQGVLRTYPLANYPSDIRSKNDMLHILSLHNIHFCVLILRGEQPSMFWADRYDSIPPEQWIETWRYSKERLDRIGISPEVQKAGNWRKPGYQSMHLVQRLQELIYAVSLPG